MRAPRIACAPIQMECRLEQAIKLGRGLNTLYIGEIVAFVIGETLQKARA